MLITKVRPIGNSLGVIIQDPILKLLDVNKGDNLRLDYDGNRIVLSKVKSKLKEKVVLDNVEDRED
jgi:antitoxin component of MazEF toxin-antitoxin module